jgi:hypothetical protein
MTEQATDITTYITIGNSDDRLAQREWAEFWLRCDRLIRARAAAIYGVWQSPAVSEYQNACWAVVVPLAKREALQADLSTLAVEFRQHSVAWVEGEPLFIPGIDREPMACGRQPGHEGHETVVGYEGGITIPAWCTGDEGA